MRAERMNRTICVVRRGCTTSCTVKEKKLRKRNKKGRRSCKTETNICAALSGSVRDTHQQEYFVVWFLRITCTDEKKIAIP